MAAMGMMGAVGVGSAVGVRERGARAGGCSGRGLRTAGVRGLRQRGARGYGRGTLCLPSAALDGASASSSAASSSNSAENTYVGDVLVEGLEVRGEVDGVWEVDFCSRPVKDEKGKKVWELIVTDNTRNLRYAEFFPSNRINSVYLKGALTSLFDQAGVGKPAGIRFFRGQMQTIIGRACQELGVKPLPSRRCVALMDWIASREADVYPAMEGYMGPQAAGFKLDPLLPSELPDHVRGESWAFVQLPYAQVREEAEGVLRGDTAGAAFPEASLRVAPADDALVPGVCVWSRRSGAVAAWTSNLELGFLRADDDRSLVVLETGINERWRYATWPRNAVATDQEAREWEAAKKAAGGLHFVAVQESAESDSIDGFFLMCECATPNV